MTNAVHEVRRRRFAGLFLRLLGHGTYGARLIETAIKPLGSGQGSIPMSKVAAPVLVTKFLWSHALELSLNSGVVVRVVGLNQGDAAFFSAKVNSAWRSAFAAKLAEFESEFAALLDAVERLEKPRRYPSACLLEPFVTAHSSVA